MGTNTSPQERYQTIVKLVTRHFPTNTLADKKQFRQILMLLRELKQREMTGEDLRRDLVGGVENAISRGEAVKLEQKEQQDNQKEEESELKRFLAGYGKTGKSLTNKFSQHHELTTEKDVSTSDLIHSMEREKDDETPKSSRKSQSRDTDLTDRL